MNQCFPKGAKLVSANCHLFDTYHLIPANLYLMQIVSNVLCTEILRLANNDVEGNPVTLILYSSPKAIP